jgi:hypothetical protein
MYRARLNDSTAYCKGGNAGCPKAVGRLNISGYGELEYAHRPNNTELDYWRYTVCLLPLPPPTFPPSLTRLAVYTISSLIAA